MEIDSDIASVKVKKGYYYSSGFSSSQKRRANSIIKAGVKSGLSTNAIQSNLIEAGVGYKRANIQHDIRRVKSFINAKTPEARAKAVKFHDNIFEPLLKKNKGVSSSQITDYIRYRKKKSREVYEDEAEAGDIAEVYESLYQRSWR